jgi:hypothetical protein
MLGESHHQGLFPFQLTPSVAMKREQNLARRNFLLMPMVIDKHLCIQTVEW